MTSEETRRNAMLTKVHTFGEANRELFPDDSVGGQAFAALATAVAQLGEFSQTKLTLSKETRNTKALARKALVGRMEAISKTARVIGESVAGIADTFALGRGRQSDQALLTNGHVFVREAERVKEQFIAHKLPPTFAADLKAAVDGFTNAIKGREAGKSGQSAAQAGIEAAFEAGLAAVRKLDVVIANQFSGDPTKLAAWERDRRIDAPRSRSKARGTTTPMPADAPAPQVPEPAKAAAPVPSAGAVTEPASPSAEASGTGSPETPLKVAS